MEHHSAAEYFGTRTGVHTHPVTHPAWMTFRDGNCPICQGDTK